MFSNKKNFNTFCGGTNSPRTSLKEVLEHGKVIIKKITNEPAKLPHYLEYDLTSLLKAGVALEALNPNILGISPIDDSKALKLLTPPPSPTENSNSHP